MDINNLLNEATPKEGASILLDVLEKEDAMFTCILIKSQVAKDSIKWKYWHDVSQIIAPWNEDQQNLFVLESIEQIGELRRKKQN